MNEYQKALIIVRENTTAASKENKLLKISVVTEDKQFKHILDATIKAYGYYIKPKWSRSVRNGSDIPVNYSQWKDYIIPKEKILIEYVENMLSKQVPQWQVIAEKNGWGPIKREG